MATTASSSGRAASPRFNILLVWAALWFAAALAWAVTIEDALMMGNMPGTMGMSPVSFLTMWVMMMAAMMLPSLAPVAAMYLRIILNQPGGMTRLFRVGGFVSGYLLVWAAFGILAYGIAWLISLLIKAAPGMMLWGAAMVLLLGGIYQFTPFKDVCLNHCRSPLGFLFQFGNYSGRLRDVQAGIYHGAYCTGCCAGLMVVMIFAGVMNLIWMIALAAIIFIEKVWRYGKQFSYAVGVTLIVLGCLLPWHPALLQDP